ncbi:hypothetical protein [Glaciecola sp. 1036]|uniref:hypothetical protein n=1 Tax=Alteromonadaceae TaxID=72275 RepID=UPI003D043CF4
MQVLDQASIQQVNGGCAELCWGDFDAGEMAAQVAGGAIAGSLAGPAGAAAGAVGAAAAYIFDVLWTD